MPRGTEDQVGFLVPQSKQILLAGFCFNLLNKFCDWTFVAIAIFAVSTGCVLAQDV